MEIRQPDPEAGAAFYADLFGWAFDERGVATLGGAAVAGLATGDAGWTTYVRVADLAATAERVRGAGGETPGAPFDLLGDPARRIRDPAGGELGIWQASDAAGAALVNAPGSWNWSNLATSEPTPEFYTDVFGWQPSPVADAAMLRLPGYADVLEARDPGIRERHAAFGAPEGFSDTVAWVVPGDGHRWTVTFAVADADAVAEHTAAAGGTVTTPPFDAPAARIAELRDPQGGAFTVSAFRGG